MRSGLNNIQENNYAFIDSQNVNLAVRDQGWKLNWTKLYKHLVKKYKCEKNYIFIGFIKENQGLYNFLENIGFNLIFKPVLKISSGKTKGNVDAELVLQAMIDYGNYDKAIIITGDGDFACLVKHLREQGKLKILIVPNIYKYSTFLKHEAKGYIDSLTNKKSKLEYLKE